MIKQMRMIVLSAALLLPFQVAAHPWGATGHMLTAQIAYDNLDVQTKAEVDRLSQVLANYQPRVSNFVPGATWMDMIKGYDLRAFNNWHFIDIPYDPDSIMNVPSPGGETVIWAIRQATTTLKSKRAGDFQKALMLRFLIHFVGDIHQPLHCIDRFTQGHPRGDMGGNLFLIEGEKQKKLHAFWDDTANLFPYVDPKSAQAWQSQIPQFAKAIEQEIPPSEVPEWKKVDSDTWAQESYQIAKEVAYANIVENKKPSDTYVQEAQKVIRKRLALGGYRLAALLKAALGKTPNP